ncbi:MAG TPA: caspase family protein, partial [Myxococcales bacterium]|nr:caspase family protein [Myxococcales bacterium]
LGEGRTVTRPSIGIAFAALLGWSCGAAAGMRRLAIVAGNDQGAAENSPLRYAEDDASRVASVLTDLGGVTDRDLTLLLGGSAADLRSALGRAQARIAEIRRETGEQTLLIFYFSGHSDGAALELGGDRFSYAELRHRLAATAADVRVAIVDACRSGALLTAKGARLGPKFDIAIADDPPTSGQVFLTSSAADENALESREIRGSIFTHNLVSALRGAADTSGDGRVTLAEAYRYAYAHTVASTSRFLLRPQHPSYDYRLSGIGELVLTELTPHSALLTLPRGFDRALVEDPARDEVLAEVPADGAGRLALPPGDYLVRVWKNGGLYETRARLAANQPLAIRWSDLSTVRLAEVGQAKGGGAAAALARAVQLFEKFDDVRAASAFRAILRSGPPDPIAAKAHAYLGLIAFNELRLADARQEFRAALEADPAVDIPTEDASPKARVAFAQAQQEAEQAPPPPVPRPAAARAPLIVAPPSNRSVETAVAMPPAHPLRTASYWVLGGAAIAAGVGLYFGVDQASAWSAIQGTEGTIETQNDQARYRRDGIIADVLYGVAGLGAVSAVTLFFVARGQAQPAITLAPSAGGATARVSF